MAKKHNNLVNRIDDYLDINASSDVVARSDKLFYDRKIESTQINKANGSAVFEVRGTNLYIVVVSGLDGYITSKCSCPYDWGPVCKHQVAALRYIQEQYGGRPQSPDVIIKQVPKKVKVPKPVLRSAKNPFVINDYHRITDELLNKLSSSQGPHYYDVETDLLAPNKLYFTCKTYYGDFKVKFWITNKGLNTSCSCGEKVKNICDHQFSILYEIANSLESDIFNQISGNKLKKLKKDLLKKYGLGNERFEKFFSLEYYNFSLNWMPKTDYENLLPIKDDEDSGIPFDIFFNMVKDDFIKAEAPVYGKNRAEKRVLGFALCTLLPEDRYF